jgi:hypothetical protein
MRALFAIGCVLALTACNPAEDAPETAQAPAADGAAQAGAPAASGGEPASTAALRTVFDTIDADGNGRMTPAESDRFLESTFAASDGDGDRRLTTAEWDAFGFGLASQAREAGKQAQYDAAKREVFTRWDTDRDGRVSRDEFRIGNNTGFEKGDRPAADNATEMTFDEYARSPHIQTLAASLN